MIYIILMLENVGIEVLEVLIVIHNLTLIIKF